MLVESEHLAYELPAVIESDAEPMTDEEAHSRALLCACRLYKPQLTHQLASKDPPKKSYSEAGFLYAPCLRNAGCPVDCAVFNGQSLSLPIACAASLSLPLVAGQPDSIKWQCDYL